jgi:hypothetical protein
VETLFHQIYAQYGPALYRFCLLQITVSPFSVNANYYGEAFTEPGSPARRSR